MKKSKTVNKEQVADKVTWRNWIGSETGIQFLYLLFGLIFIFLIMARIQYSTNAICCGDWDGYYHIRFSSLLWQNFSSFQWLPEFKWLPLTVLNPEDYADHHFLFHLLQIPFLWFFDDVTAAKIAAITYGSLAIFSAYWLICRYGGKNPIIWLLALIVAANPFLYRMNMAKAPPLTIIITVLGIHLLFQRNYLWLLPLMFLFVWTYSLFPLLLIAAIIWSAIIAWNERKFEWRPVGYTFAGMVLGNLINPYFPNNLKLFWEHFYTKFTVAGDFAVMVGGEWYPHSGQELLMLFPVAMLAMLVGYVLFNPRSGKLPEHSSFFLVFVTILLAAQFRSKRFAEYFPPFAILFAAFSIKDFFFHIRGGNVKTEPSDEEVATGKSLKDRLPVFIQRGVLAALTLLMLVNLVGIDLTRYAGKGWRESPGFKQLFSLKMKGMISGVMANEDDFRYRRSMDWARANIPEGNRIFNTNWDDFPKLFFLNQKHSYVFGLDPNYLYSKNPDLYKLVLDIVTARTENAAPLVREKLGASHIFIDIRESGPMLEKMLESGWVDLPYRDEEAIILRIREEKGEPVKKEEVLPDLGNKIIDLRIGNTKK
jgi:hypothetical protein